MTITNQTNMLQI